MDYNAVMTASALALVALAARDDLVRSRIPNALNATALVVAVAVGCLASGLTGLMNSIGGALAGCGALLPFYLLRGMGAGDVKLMAAAGAFLGPVDALTAAALAIVMGGGLAVAVVVLRLVESTPLAEFSLRDASTPVLRLFATISAARKERFPYANAIAAGVVTTLALRGSLEQFYSFWAFE
jgi:prepilin peptidase CpaA